MKKMTSVKTMTLWCYILLMLLGKRSTLGQRVDTCDEENNCTIQVSKTSALHCSVGRMMACDRLHLPAEPTNPMDPSLYTQLSSISIIKRPYATYGDRHVEVDSLNFSFIVPSSDIGDGGIQGVKAEFMEAAGYSENFHHYHETRSICRFFNFSGSSFTKTDMAERTLEIPYPCIGIGIIPSVFYLNLTSVPTSHRLDYVITWERGAAAYDDYYDYRHDAPPAIWRDQLLAVATDAYRRMVDVVFEGPESQGQISSLEVSLIKDTEIVQTKLVEIGVTRVTFLNVGQGQYRVKVYPRGGLCEVTSCNILTSALIEMTKGTEDEDTNAMVILGVIIAIVLVSLVIIAMVCMRKRQIKASAGAKRTILVISLTTRDLEKQTTSKFCEFLAATLNTTVVYTLPKSSHTPNQSLNEGESLLQQVRHEENVSRPECYKLCIILQFSYPCNQLSSQSTSNGAEIHEDHNLIRDLLSYKQNKGLFKQRVMKASKQKPMFVTFVKDSSSHMCVTSAASEHYYSTGDADEDDQVTVMLHPPHEQAKTGDTMSLCNRISSHALSHNNDSGPAYLLPHDIYKLHKDLSSLINAENASLTEDKVKNFESWTIALFKFNKAAENPWMDDRNSMCDMMTVSGIMTENEVDINNSLQRRQYSSPAGNQQFSSTNSIYPPEYFIPPSQVTWQSKLADVHPTLAEVPTVDCRLGMNSQASPKAAWKFKPQSSMLSVDSLPDSFSNMTEAEETFREMEDQHAREKTMFLANDEVTRPETESSRLTLKIPQYFSEEVGNGELGASSSSDQSMRTSGYGSSATDVDQPPWRDQWKTVSESHDTKLPSNASGMYDDAGDVFYQQSFREVASPGAACDREETFTGDYFGKTSPDHRLSCGKDSPSENVFGEAEKLQEVNPEVSKTRHIPEISLSQHVRTECPAEFARSIIPPDVL